MSTQLSASYIADMEKRQIKSTVKHMSPTPRLAVVTAGDAPATHDAERRIDDACREVGILTRMVHFNVEASQDDVLGAIRTLNGDPSVTAIVVCRLLPPHLDINALSAAIDPRKDAQCVHPYNIGKLHADMDGVSPCVPWAAVKLLGTAGIDLEGRSVLIADRTGDVGGPLTALLTRRNATVFLCDGHTPGELVGHLLQRCDVLISAVDNPRWLGNDPWFGPAPGIIIDLGRARDDDGHVHGDLPDAWTKVKGLKYTPVPGGVDVMADVVLLSNVIYLATHKKED